MNVLSLFDGMSCWQLALKMLWITDYKYYASEIEKYPMQVAKHNFPDTIHIWDVTKVTRDTIQDGVDIIIWGSPCQWFSFAGKQLNFDDPRSKLFFEFARLVNEFKPKYFMLENVKMKKEFQAVISENLFWVQPVVINSSLLTAQNRTRLYWVGKLQEDWTYKQVDIPQPEDKWILLKDILEDNVDEKYNLSDTQYDKLKAYESNSRLSPLEWKSYCLNTMQGGHRQPKIQMNVRINEFSSFNQDNVFCGADDKVPTLTTRDLVLRPKTYSVWIRKLTPLECERLQWVPDNYSSMVSNSQRYKMLWNGWTVPVIAHIFKHLLSA